jgi:hypothetical protein
MTLFDDGDANDDEDLFRVALVSNKPTESPTHTPMHSQQLVKTIDLVLIDQQSVEKRSLHLMDTVNAKKRWTTIYWHVNKFLKESHIVTRLAKERASFLSINDIWNACLSSLLFYSVSGNGNSMVKTFLFNNKKGKLNGIRVRRVLPNRYTPH